MDLKIYVSMHKPSPYPESDWLVPIGIGGYSEDGIINDISGRSIYSENHAYSEVTAQYWVRHNRPSAYVGFCHYRRYFSFDTRGLPPGDMLHASNSGVMQSLAEDTQRYYCESLLSKFDLIAPRLTFCPNGIKDQVLSGGMPQAIWDYFEQAVSVAAPDQGKHFDRLILSQHAHFFNMYVMGWADFCRYFDSMYQVLEVYRTLVSGGDYGSYSGNRWPGVLSERYFNLWLSTSGLSVVQVPIVRLPD